MAAPYLGVFESPAGGAAAKPGLPHRIVIHSIAGKGVAEDAFNLLKSHYSELPYTFTIHKSPRGGSFWDIWATIKNVAKNLEPLGDLAASVIPGAAPLYAGVKNLVGHAAKIVDNLHTQPGQAAAGLKLTQATHGYKGHPSVRGPDMDYSMPSEERATIAKDRKAAYNKRYRAAKKEREMAALAAVAAAAPVAALPSDLPAALPAALSAPVLPSGVGMRAGAYTVSYAIPYLKRAQELAHSKTEAAKIGTLIKKASDIVSKRQKKGGRGRFQ